MHKKTPEIERILDEIAQNTRTNCHTENAVLIADTFGNEEDQQIAKYLQNQNNKKGHMLPAEILIRTRLIDGIRMKQNTTVCLWINEALK